MNRGDCNTTTEAQQQQRTPKIKSSPCKENLSPLHSLMPSQALLGGALVENPILGCSLKRKRPPRIQIPGVLREIQNDDVCDTQQKKFDFGGGSVSGEEGGGGFARSDGALGVGVSSIKGKKKFMEDAYKIVSHLNGDPTKGFYGVYDGHGGRKAAEFVSENLHANILQKLEICSENESKEEAVKAGYLKTDKEFLELEVGSGACCVTALIQGQDIVVSNLGDCRAVLSRCGVAESLTADHRAEKECERRRIEDKGGYVEIHRGAWRVHGILTVSRSIGDAHLKDWVVAEPETKIFSLEPDMEYMILASDGLWEKVGNQEAVDIVLGTCSIQKKHVGLTEELFKENKDEHVCTYSTSSPKIKRVSLLRQQQPMNSLSPSQRETTENSKEENLSHDFPDSENRSPPSKLRRISLFQRRTATTIKTQSPSKNNTKAAPPPGSLVRGCKELINLAVSRGSLDDITVMVIDLNHFRSSINA